MRMRFLINFLLVTAMVMLQTLFPQFLRPWGVFPDFPMLMLVFVSVVSGWKEAQAIGFFTGLLQDFLSVAPLGFYACLGLMTALVFGMLKDKLDINNFVFPFLLGFLGSLFRSFVVYLLVFWFRFEISSYSYSFLVWQYWVMCAVNALLLPFVFFLLMRMRFFKKHYFQDRI